MSTRMNGSMLLLDKESGEACIGEVAQRFTNSAERSGFSVIQFTEKHDIS